MLRHPRPALPAAFRHSRLLIVGCGDVGRRVARHLPSTIRVRALTSSIDHIDALRLLGITPIRGDLDRPASLRRLAGLAPRVLHLAPPPGDGATDPRTRALLTALARTDSPTTLIYGSTTGVYGDAGGAQFDETRPVAPATTRAARRVDAEQQLRRCGRSGQLRATILRIPGIYATDRPGGHPRERLLRGTPVLRAEDDVHTNHIHADDLARLLGLCLFRGGANRVYNACDDSGMPMGDYFDRVADAFALPRPPRLGRSELSARLSPLSLSFMSESRRIRNDRLKRELRVHLRYPTVADALRCLP